MKKDIKNAKKKNNKIKNYSLKGCHLNTGLHQLGLEAEDLIEKFSETGEVDIVDSRLVSLLYQYISQNKKELIKDRTGAIRARTFKSVASSVLTVVGAGSFTAALLLSLESFGAVELTSLMSLIGTSTLGFGCIAGSAMLKKSSNTAIIDDLLVEMENKYGVSCMPTEEKNNKLAVVPTIMQDCFLEEVKTLMNFAKYHKEESFDEEIARLATLTQEYIAAKRGEIKEQREFDRYSFFDRLTDLELKIFGKNNEVGFKQLYLLAVKGPQLVERLKFMGVSEENIANDLHLQDVFKEITRISSMSYEGCERELLQLFRIAQDYCKSAFALQSSDVKCLPPVKPEIMLAQKLSIVGDAVTNNINLALALQAKCLNAASYDEQAEPVKAL